MRAGLRLRIVATAIILTTKIRAQTPKQLVEQAVHTELAADRNDHSLWRYLQEEKLPTPTLSVVVETSDGSLKRKIEANGRPLSAGATTAELQRIQALLHDPSQQQKQQRNSQHDDQSAAQLLQMLPQAFVWKLTGETPELMTLSFAPDPNFSPPDMESRVMSAMAGELVVDRKQNRIRTMRGTLSHEVDIGFGLLGKLRQGGTFDVERREIAPGLWQITETHVHIDGRALLFKTIGQQEDEVNSRFVRVPEGTTLDQAAAFLRSPEATQAAAETTHGR